MSGYFNNIRITMSRNYRTSRGVFGGSENAEKCNTTHTSVMYVRWGVAEAAWDHACIHTEGTLTCQESGQVRIAFGC